jgi:hypothetical protein
MTQNFIPGFGTGKLNNTVVYRNQSEENIVFHANFNHDSFYSFALGNKNYKDGPNSVYDGAIERRSFPR